MKKISLQWKLTLVTTVLITILCGCLTFFLYKNGVYYFDTLQEFMTDISDAYEASYTIMLNLNKTWIEKQGDFFVESPIILLAAIIWYLKIYKNGIYCTFPHAVELLNKPYSDLFTILTSYPELEN